MTDQDTLFICNLFACLIVYRPILTELDNNKSPSVTCDRRN
jgi:hypothetical protein